MAPGAYLFAVLGPWGLEELVGVMSGHSPLGRRSPLRGQHTLLGEGERGSAYEGHASRGHAPPPPTLRCLPSSGSEATVSGGDGLSECPLHIEYLTIKRHTKT